MGEGDGFRVFFRGFRIPYEGWGEVEKGIRYEYNDFFIVDVLNDGLPVNDIILEDSEDEDESVHDGDEEEVDPEDDDAAEEMKESESTKEGAEADGGVSDDDVLKPFCEPLMNCLGHCRAFLIDSSIYFVGNSLAPESEIRDYIEKDDCRQPIKCLKSVARINVDSGDKEWTLAPEPLLFDWWFESAALGHTIYFFNNKLPKESQLYDTLLNSWSVVDSGLPPHLERCHVAPRLIPDPARNRILFHFSFGGLKTPAIYAWYPNKDVSDGHPWSALISPFPDRSWRKKSTIVDGLFFIYFRKSPQLFEAYDLVTEKWLKIKWLTAIPPFLTRRYKAKSMFYMGKGKLCVTMSLHVPRPVFGSNVYFIFFKFTRSKNGRIIYIRYQSMKLFYAPRLLNTRDYVPLGDVC